jgi:hypothetical protein
MGTIYALLLLQQFYLIQSNQLKPVNSNHQSDYYVFRRYILAKSSTVLGDLIDIFEYV